MLNAVFEFGDSPVSEVLVPRPEVVGIEKGKTLAEFLAIYSESPISRFPVYEENMDNVVGILSIKDVLMALAKGARGGRRPGRAPRVPPVGAALAVAVALGVEASVDFGPGVLTMELSGGYRDFIPTRDTPGRENLDGTEAQVALSYGVPLSQALQLDVSARVAAVNADKVFEDYFAFGADAALSATFDTFGRPLVATLGGGVVTSRYETPDFQLLDIKRRDTSVAAYFGLATDLDEVTSIDGAVTYRRRFSNYDIFDNKGVSFTIRLARRL